MTSFRSSFNYPQSYSEAWPIQTSPAQYESPYSLSAHYESLSHMVAQYPSIIQLPEIPAQQYEIDPNTIQMLPSFYGDLHEDPYKHLDDFFEICSTIKIQDLPDDTLRLILFPFSLKDRAKCWLRTIGRIVTTWINLQQEFLKKYFPIGRTNAFRRAITGFSQLLGEKFHASWERLQELTRRCRHHGLPKWQIVQSFYDGLTEFNRQLVDLSCGGTFLSKSEDEAYSLLTILSEASSNHASLSLYNSVTQSESKEMFELQHSMDPNLVVNMGFLAPKMNIPSPTHQEKCTFCTSPAHYVSMCPAVAQLPLAIQAQVQAIHEAPPSTNFYSLGWEQHSNFSGKSHQVQVHCPSIKNCQTWNQIQTNFQDQINGGGQPAYPLLTYSLSQSPCFQFATPHQSYPQSHDSQPTYQPPPQQIGEDDRPLQLQHLILTHQASSSNLKNEMGQFVKKSMEENLGVFPSDPMDSLINPSLDCFQHTESNVSFKVTQLEFTRDMSNLSWRDFDEVHCQEELGDDSMTENLDIFKTENQDKSEAIIIVDECSKEDRQIEVKEGHEGIEQLLENPPSKTFDLVKGIDNTMSINDLLKSCDTMDFNSIKELQNDGSIDNSIQCMDDSSFSTDSFVRYGPLEPKSIMDDFQLIDLSFKHTCDDFTEFFWMVDTCPSFSDFFLSALPLPCYYLRESLQPICMKAHELVFEPIGIG